MYIEVKKKSGGKYEVSPDVTPSGNINYYTTMTKVLQCNEQYESGTMDDPYLIFFDENGNNITDTVTDSLLSRVKVIIARVDTATIYYVGELPSCFSEWGNIYQVNNFYLDDDVIWYSHDGGQDSELLYSGYNCYPLQLREVSIAQAIALGTYHG